MGVAMDITHRSAVISSCGTYRFNLSRMGDPCFNSKGTVLFVLNNPSIADSEIDDPTVRRGWGFTVSWGYHRMVFANTNPHRSTDPTSALIPPEEIMVENDSHLRFAAQEADLVICAWGTKARHAMAERASSVLRGQKPLRAIALSKDGIPKHPLYLKGDLKPVPWMAQL